MSIEYAEGRIREALKLCHGNETRARQQVIAWSLDDAKLLQALVRPHLTGIVAYALNRVVTRGEDDETALPDVPKALDMPPDTMGKEILNILASRNAAQFGREAGSAPVRKKQASQRHVDALRLMASKAKDKSKDKD